MRQFQPDRRVLTTFMWSVSFIFEGNSFIRKNCVINWFCFQRTEIDELREELRDEKNTTRELRKTLQSVS